MLHPFSHQRQERAATVQLDNITCGYDNQPILRNLSLDVLHGDFLGILGPSGSGKTTLLKAMMGTAGIYGGRVLVDGISTAHMKPKVGYVPQLQTIDWGFPVTVKELVMMGRTMDQPLFPWNSREDQRIVDEMLDKLGLSELKKRHIADLSGGQQQRVFLARALVSNPRLLLLDEPTAGVDIKTRDDVMHLLHDLNHQGITIVITTHEINAVAAHLPRIICLNGRIVAEGTPSEVFTPEIFYLTYGAQIPVIHYQGMTLAAETPHSYEEHDQHMYKS